MQPTIGIDLGTTNSVVAVVENGTPRVIKNPESGEAVLPSVVGLDPTGNLLVGQPALNQAALFPESTIRSVKRKMGEHVQLTLGEKQLSPPEVSAVILGRLRQWAEQDLGCEVNRAVITVPAYFDDGQREATRHAGELAGLEVLRIVNEPTAAALVYDSQSHDPHKVLVYDLGGGTFDVSIVAIESGVVEVLATFGDTHLGGDDFDALLCNQLVNATGDLQEPILADAGAMARLSLSAEAAKRRLSFDTFTEVAEEFLLPGNPSSHLETTLERDDYEQSIEPLLDRTISCVDSALKDAGLHAGQLDKVILVGGSTRTPLVEQLLTQKLGHRPSAEIDPDLCVALGAAVQGALLSGQDVDRVLIEITPHTLGVRCAETRDPLGPANAFAPIIPRGSALPCKRSQTFYTMVPGQTEVSTDVYQGEAAVVTENIFVGKVELADLDPDSPADSPISVTFTMNLNGMLEVRAVDRRTGKEASAEIKRLNESSKQAGSQTEFGSVSADEISEMLGRVSAGQPSQIDEAQSPQTDEALEAESKPSNTLTRRLDELMPSIHATRQNADEQDAEEIDELVAELKAAADSNNSEAFAEKVEALEDLLFYLNDA
ncbi:Hsp70 family protein [Rhodopirellula baltica]|uniref:Molecular chaperone DnaK n=1 Tax=Rhodopirellula baltica SWK14 TaxID=993516 RepID=L7CK07_RHOBT|nr:Hsp70 family protein [Rhodopirellula baltica]ELP33391.1 molecular chaperone DnaK [Rhodopirellula baltica SWK14]